MKATTITRGGQISVPASVRRRWQTSRVTIEDRGDSLVVRPMPADPVRAALGSLADAGPNSAVSRARVRREESGSDRPARAAR